MKTNSGLDNLEEALASENNGVYDSVVYILDTKEIYANNKINTPGPWGGGSGSDDNFVKIEDLSEVAISGDYYDLKNTPEEITQDTINDWGFTKNSGNYSKPDNGIPMSDLSNDVQNQIIIDNITYDVVNHNIDDVNCEIYPNIFHVWGVVPSLAITLASPLDSNIMNEYLFQFTSGDEVTSLTIPSTVVWPISPNIEANKTYQVSIVNNIGVIISVPM